jgi:hypothetical protein
MASVTKIEAFVVTTRSVTRTSEPRGAIVELDPHRGEVSRHARLPQFDVLPSSLIDPLRGLTMWKCGRSWNLVLLPTSSTKGGKRGVLEVPGLD